MKVSTILKKARKYLTNEKNWAKGASAVDAKGEHVDERARGAKCCVGGACLRFLPYGISLLETGAYDLWIGTEKALDDAVPPGPFKGNHARYNDAKRRTHAQILKFLDRAIEKQLKREAQR